MLTREGVDVKLGEPLLRAGPALLQQDMERRALRAGQLGRACRAGERNALEDRWIRSRTAHAIREVSAAMEEYRPTAPAELYRFFWNDLCDWYLEVAKRRLAPGADAADREAAEARACCRCVAALHPYLAVPHRGLWSHVPGTDRAR
jgi:valyl-tRNA synthetase